MPGGLEDSAGSPNNSAAQCFPKGGEEHPLILSRLSTKQCWQSAAKPVLIIPGKCNSPKSADQINQELCFFIKLYSPMLNGYPHRAEQ